MINIPQRLLGEALLFSAKNSPSKVAVIIKGKEYSYSELNENAKILARYFEKSNIKKGDRVAIYMSNSWEAIISIYGVTLA